MSEPGSAAAAGPEVLLVNLPPWEPCALPLGLASVIAALRVSGRRVMLLDANAEWHHRLPQDRHLWSMTHQAAWLEPPDAARMVERFRPDFIATVERILEVNAPVTAFVVAAPRQYFVALMAEELRCRDYSGRIVVGGPATFIEPERRVVVEAVGAHIDAIVVGEGEVTICELVAEWLAGGDAADLAGVCLWRDGGWTEPQPRPFIEDLDRLPMPDFSDFDLDHYESPGLTVEWGRGCIRRCGFCEVRSMWGRRRLKSPFRVVEEMLSLAELYDRDYFAIADPAANACPTAHLEEILERLAEAPRPLRWTANLIAHRGFDSRLAHKMRAAGCERADVGVESGSDNALRLMRKGVSAADNERVLRALSEAGIEVVVYLLIGYPGETEADLEATLDFLRRNRQWISRVRSANALVLKYGTPVLDELRSSGEQIMEKGPAWDLEWCCGEHNTLAARRAWVQRVLLELENLGISCDMSAGGVDEDGALAPPPQPEPDAQPQPEAPIRIGHGPPPGLRAGATGYERGKTMKVQLANPPWSRGGRYGVRAGSRWPHFEEAHHEYMPFPFFLAYSAAVLENDGFEIDCVDALAEKLTPQRFVERVQAFDPEVLLLELSTISLPDDLQTIAELRRRGFSARIVAAGLHQPMYSPAFLEQHEHIDAVLVGEYELASGELLRRWRDGGADETVPGALLRRADGTINDGGRRALADVNQLPWPARHRFDMSLYHDEPGSIPRPSAQMWASRGCPFGCIFCAWPQILYGNRSYRPRDPQAVADEFEAMVRAWGFSSVYFDDDTFNVRRDLVLELCREIDKRQVQVPWAAMCRPDLMDQELLEALQKSGFAAAKYGLESASDQLLEVSQKGLDLERAVHNILLTQEMGIKIHLTFMFGLPGETRETAKKTIDLALRLRPESLQFTIATPFPGSRYQDILEERGLLVHQSVEHCDGFRTAAVHTGHLAPEELEEIVEEANRRWRGTWVERQKDRGDYPVDVSVVIPSYHRRESLLRCLKALKQQSFDRFEVILVDNGSRDDSVPAALEMMPGVRLIQRPEPIGFAAAVNLGIGAARGRLVAVLNNDAEPEPGWLMAMVEAIDQRPEAGFAASKVVRRDDPEVLDSMGESLSSSCFPFQIGNGTSAANGCSEVHEVFGAPATAAVYRRRLLDDVGGFDEDFETYLEDLDLSLRAQLRGWHCVAVPAAVVHHEGHASTGGTANPEVVRLLGRNWVQLLLKSVPRSVLVRNLPGIAACGLRQLAHHTLRSRHPVAFTIGLAQGLARTRRMVGKRKTALGWRRVDDDRITELLAEGDELLRRTRADRR